MTLPLRNAAPNLLRRPPLAWRGFAWCACLLIATLAAAQHHPGAVRNEAPERPATPPDEQWPVACPRSLAETLQQAAADPGSAEHHLQEFLDLHALMRYDDALQAAVRLVNAAPDTPICHYNHACVLARLGRHPQAIEALERALSAGWRNFSHTLLDPDLRSLHRTDEFHTLIERMRALAAAERVRRTPLRNDDWQVIAGELAANTPGILRRYRVPGAVLALVQDGRCVWVESSGSENIGTGQPLERDARFGLRTPMDLLALVAAAALEHEGKLTLPPLMRQALRDSPDRIEDRAGQGRAVSRRSTHTSRQPSRQVLSRTIPSSSAVWPTVVDEGRGLEILQVAVEVAGRDSFGDFCARRILRPLLITSLQPIDEQSGKICEGHSRLGTIVVPDPAAPDIVATTAADAAGLMELLMFDRDAHLAEVLPDEAVRAVIELAKADLGAAGLHVRMVPTDADELLLEAAEVRAGSGCLLRWYPEHGRGVVIMFNSESGTEAALRLAQIALGG